MKKIYFIYCTSSFLSKSFSFLGNCFMPISLVSVWNLKKGFGSLESDENAFLYISVDEIEPDLKDQAMEAVQKIVEDAGTWISTRTFVSCSWQNFEKPFIEHILLLGRSDVALKVLAEPHQKRKLESRIDKAIIDHSDCLKARNFCGSMPVVLMV